MTTLEGFKRLGKDVWVPAKALASVTRHGDIPEYVIIFGWMGAQLTHIRKYVYQYKSLYPNLNPIIVVSRPEHFYEGKTKRERSVAPLADYLHKQGILDGQANVLIHIFSNGGAFQLAQLSKLIQDGRYKSPQHLAFIYDSCPGSTSLSTSINAFTISIKPRLLKYLSIISLSLLFSVIYLILLITRIDSPIDRTRKALNSLTIFPGTKATTPRLYIFSEIDQLVPVEAVERHVREAKTLGYDVSVRKFADCQHVQNARVHPEEYWKAVREVWERAKIQ